MSEPELMTEADIHAFGVEIVYKQLQEAEWLLESADVFADRATHPQIVGHKDGEIGFFVVRTDMYPSRGRIEGEEVFQNLVRHANAHGANCYFASVSIANSQGTTDDEMAVPVKGVGYNIAFDGLVRMALPEQYAK
jgi:hypothetical protein